jgi:ParB-like nuclease domain
VTTVVRCVVAFVVAFAGLLAAPAHTPASAMLTTVISACASNDAIHDQPVEHVAPRSYGRFARPDGGTPLVGYTSDVPRLLAQVDKPSTTKGSGVQESVVFLSVLPDGQVAANSVRSAAPGVFTRTEALSGRASSRAVDEIAESMRANGWQGDPIKVVEPQGQRIVVDGHHRLAAAQRAGIDVQYEVVDPSTVIGRGMWTSVDAILQDTYTIGPNRLR